MLRLCGAKDKSVTHIHIKMYAPERVNTKKNECHNMTLVLEKCLKTTQSSVLKVGTNKISASCQQYIHLLCFLVVVSVFLGKTQVFH